MSPQWFTGRFLPSAWEKPAELKPRESSESLAGWEPLQASERAAQGVREPERRPEQPPKGLQGPYSARVEPLLP